MDGVNVDEENVRDVDPDFEPWSRPRSCTWPKISTVKQEGEDVAGTPPGIVLSLDPVQGKVADPEGGVTVWVGGATTRKGCSRRNAWGSHSYAELISQAIESSPEKRLTLAQIYDWMVNTVPYFRDKGDSNSSAGWKNSVRHNLSLHSKFLRVQNEATGKSSWWTLNPEAGRSAKETRHRHSMDNSSRLLKSRTQARQAKQARAAVLAGSGVSTQGKGGPEGPKADGSSQSLPGSSPLSGSRLDDVDVWTGFRSRTDSNASTLSGRRSPIAPPQEEEEDGPKEVVRSGLTASTEMSMAELDLSGKLTLMAGQQRAVNLRGCPPAPPTHLRFSPLQSLQPAAPSSQATSRWPGSGCQFQSPPFDQGVSYGTHLVHSLEALLTANGPQLSDIGVAQGVSGVPATCSQPLEKVGLEKRNLMSVTPAGPSHSTARLSLETLHSLAGQGEGLLPETGLHCFSTLVGHNNLSASQEQLPTDLDADMFTENLACDIDYIINSDLLDGDAVDFSFDMIAPVNQGCHGNIQDWVPS